MKDSSKRIVFRDGTVVYSLPSIVTEPKISEIEPVVIASCTSEEAAKAAERLLAS